ncbi:DUF2256 domain-containing protein [Neoroseomonas lacus]|uniref:DUF2256 domain-containing protein n=1 Tax=Neoroseomonas lacus TaxID=287609 RepID=UPI00166340C0|nr:DUF2256 domain-containing protein [Neoroseomonas lacus]
MTHHKLELPEKTCEACARPFAWRRKWAQSWAEVRYCSDACRTWRRGAVRERMTKPEKGA